MRRKDAAGNVAFENPRGPVDVDAHFSLDKTCPLRGGRVVADPTCGVPAGDSLNIPDLNDECGIWSDLDDFRLQVLEHEEEHQNSLNKCIGAVNTDGRLAKIEAIVGKTETAAEDSAKTLWTDGVRKALLRAEETNQGDEYSASPGGLPEHVEDWYRRCL